MAPHIAAARVQRQRLGLQRLGLQLEQRATRLEGFAFEPRQQACGDALAPVLRVNIHALDLAKPGRQGHCATTGCTPRHVAGHGEQDVCLRQRRDVQRVPALGRTERLLTGVGFDDQRNQRRLVGRFESDRHGG